MEPAVPAVTQQLRAILQPPVAVMVKRVDIIHLIDRPSSANIGEQIYHVRERDSTIHIRVGGRVHVTGFGIETGDVVFVFVRQILRDIGDDKVTPLGGGQIDFV